MGKVGNYIKLNSGYTIPTVALGTWKISPAEAPSIIHTALNKGYRHFDSAILYGNEKEVGEGIARWLKEDPSKNKREDVFYTSKLWTFNTYDQAKHEIKKALDAVEGNLGYIDLLLLHSPMAGPVGRLEAWKALQETVDVGKVKSIGVSSWGEHHLKQLFEWEGYKIKPAVNQIEISPWIMRQELADYCKSEGIAVEAYSPLAHGGRLSDPTVQKIAKKYGVSSAQVLIRWSLEKGYIPLPKTSNVNRLSSNLDVYDFELTAAEVDEISHPESHDATDWDVTDVE